MRLPLRFQIILPFFVLLLFIGMVGIGVVTARVTSATTGEFDNGLLRASLLANEQLTTVEADRLSQLREATDTEGVADAVAAGDLAALSRLLVAVAVNARPVELMIRVLNRQGQQILVIERGVASGPGDRSSSPSYAYIPAVQQALAGQKDALGDRYVFLGSDGPGPIVYWVGPVRDDREQVLGVILLGQSLADIAGGVGKARASEVAFYDTEGQALTSSLPSLRSLPAHVLRRLTHDHPMRLTQTLDGHAFAFLVSDWTFRDVWLGYFAIALNADAVLDSVGHVRNILVFLFVVAALLTLLLGSVLASTHHAATGAAGRRHARNFNRGLRPSSSERGTRRDRVSRRVQRDESEPAGKDPSAGREPFCQHGGARESDRCSGSLHLWPLLASSRHQPRARGGDGVTA